MTLDAKLLQKLSDWKPAGNGRHVLAIPDDGCGWSATLTADRTDELSCLTWELALRRSAGPVPDLRAWAEGVAGRLTGLLEPLRVVEVDPVRAEAQLRSQQPTQRGERLFYYEVLLTGSGDAHLRRYQANDAPGHRREQVAFALTHESLAKVALDVTTGL